MPQFMLLLHGDPTKWLDISPEEMQKWIEKYVAWGDRLRKAGVFVASHKLVDDAGKVVRGKAGQPARVTDGPYSETKEVFGGCYLIKAANYDEAVERSRDCPQLEHGGTIEVRQVDFMGRPEA